AAGPAPRRDRRELRRRVLDRALDQEPLAGGEPARAGPRALRDRPGHRLGGAADPVRELPAPDWLDLRTAPRRACRPLLPRARRAVLARRAAGHRPLPRRDQLAGHRGLGHRRGGLPGHLRPAAARRRRADAGAGRLPAEPVRRVRALRPARAGRVPTAGRARLDRPVTVAALLGRHAEEWRAAAAPPPPHPARARPPPPRARPALAA